MLSNMTPNIPATVINPGPGEIVSGFNLGPYFPGLSGLAGLAGLGIASTTGTDEDTRGLMDGLKLWTSPKDAFTAVNRIALGTDKAPITYTVGAALPPLILVGVLMALVTGRRR